MSLFSLAEGAAQAQPTPNRTRQALTPGGPRDALPAAPPSKSPVPPAVATALEKLVGFVPTETVLLWGLAVPAARALHPEFFPSRIGDGGTLTDWLMLALLAAMTPTLLILGFLSRLAADGRELPPCRQWPWWKALAATIAFAVWAFAIPGNPFIDSGNPGQLMGAWLLAAIVSTLLALVDPIVMRKVIARQKVAAEEGDQSGT